ncbi:hypothetical protein ACOZ4Y_02655 [Komagataeibacter rhaeticus]
MFKSKPMDLTGHTYGKLRPIELMPHVPGTKPRWRCQCACGGEKIAAAFNLRHGDTTRCDNCRAPQWTKQQIQAVRDLKAQGKTGREIAKILGRGVDSVYRKLQQMRPREKPAAITPDAGFKQYMNAPCQRNCLRCGKVFDAIHRTNRLCYNCGHYALECAPV